MHDSNSAPFGVTSRIYLSKPLAHSTEGDVDPSRFKPPVDGDSSHERRLHVNVNDPIVQLAVGDDVQPANEWAFSRGKGLPAGV